MFIHIHSNFQFDIKIIEVEKSFLQSSNFLMYMNLFGDNIMLEINIFWKMDRSVGKNGLQLPLNLENTSPLNKKFVVQMSRNK